MSNLGKDIELVAWNGQQPVSLKREPAASGVRFLIEKYALHAKGGEASWTIGCMAPMICRTVAVPR